MSRTVCITGMVDVDNQRKELIDGLRPWFYVVYFHEFIIHFKLFQLGDPNFCVRKLSRKILISKMDLRSTYLLVDHLLDDFLFWIFNFLGLFFSGQKASS